VTGIVVAVVVISLILAMSVVLVIIMTIILRRKMTVADTSQSAENGVNTNALGTPKKMAVTKKSGQTNVTWEVIINETP